MSVAWSTAVVLVPGMALAGLPASATESEADRSAVMASIEPEVLDQLATDDTATFWVYLREQADLSAASTMSNRDDQGWFVYEQLTETAEISQARLAEMLAAEAVAFEQFWIANTSR